MLKTSFWKKATARLNPAVQERFARHFESAERWDLAIDEARDAWVQVSAVLRKAFRFSLRARPAPRPGIPNEMSG